MASLKPEFRHSGQSQKSLWDSLADITTPLTIESEVEKSSRWMDHVLSDEERALSAIADDIFSEQNNMKEKNTTEGSSESNGIDVSIEFSDIGEGGEREDGSSEESNVLGDENDPEIVVEDVEESENGNEEVTVRIAFSHSVQELGLIGRVF